MKTKQRLAFLIVAILIFTGIGLGVSQLKKEARPIGKLYTESKTIPVALEREISAKSEDNIISAVKKVSPAVVSISGVAKRKYHFEFPRDEFFEKFFEEFFPRREYRYFKREYRAPTLGSGVIINKEGYILTNSHVVSGVDKLEVELLDGRKFKGKVVGIDPETDIAIIKIKDHNLPVAILGDSDRIEIGQWAIAIGNPMGYQHTVTVGVVSATKRRLKGTTYEDLIQTDAAINPGNSGGPLINIQGEVMGINVAIERHLATMIQGIGFAIPVNTAKKVIDELITYGEVTRPWIGVMIQELTPELAEEFKVKEGVLIGDVMPDTPAEKAGIKRGDVVTAVDGKEVKTPSELRHQILNKKIGQKVMITFIRDRVKKSIPVITVERPKEMPEIEAKAPGKIEIEEERWLGMDVSSITPQLQRRYNLTETQGVVVTDIEFGSQAFQIGVREGDIILEINRRKVQSMADFTKITKRMKKSARITLLIKRKGYTMYLSLYEKTFP
jgi:serine protease Do